MNWPVILFIPVLIALLVAISPVIDVLTTELFSTLDSATSLHYTNLVKLLVGLVVFILVLGIVLTLTEIRGSPPAPQYMYSDWE